MGSTVCNVNEYGPVVQKCLESFHTKCPLCRQQMEGSAQIEDHMRGRHGVISNVAAEALACYTKSGQPAVLNYLGAVAHCITTENNARGGDRSTPAPWGRFRCPLCCDRYKVYTIEYFQMARLEKHLVECHDVFNSDALCSIRQALLTGILEGEYDQQLAAPRPLFLPFYYGCRLCGSARYSPHDIAIHLSKAHNIENVRAIWFMLPYCQGHRSEVTNFIWLLLPNLLEMCRAAVEAEKETAKAAIAPVSGTRATPSAQATGKREDGEGSIVTVMDNEKPGKGPQDNKTPVIAGEQCETPGSAKFVGHGRSRDSQDGVSMELSTANSPQGTSGASVNSPSTGSAPGAAPVPKEAKKMSCMEQPLEMTIKGIHCPFCAEAIRFEDEPSYLEHGQLIHNDTSGLFAIFWRVAETYPRARGRRARSYRDTFPIECTMPVKDTAATRQYPEEEVDDAAAVNCIPLSCVEMEHGGSELPLGLMVLRDHRTISTLTAVRNLKMPITCMGCYANCSFKSLDALYTHLRLTHLVEIGFHFIAKMAQADCARFTTREDGLAHYALGVHQLDWAAMFRPSEPRVHMRADLNKTSYCPLCLSGGRLFASASQLEAHLSNWHNMRRHAVVLRLADVMFGLTTAIEPNPDLAFNVQRLADPSEIPGEEDEVAEESYVGIVPIP